MKQNRILFILSFVSSLAFWTFALIIPQYNIWQWYLPFYLAFYIFYMFIFRDPDESDFQIMDTLGAWSTLLLVLAVKWVFKL